MPIRIEMLPAERGDSILIEYGEASVGEHRILIDGGHARAYAGLRERLLAVPPDPEGRRRFELLVVTHIDGDHIDGVIAMLQDSELNLWFSDIWFNGWRQIENLDGSTATTPVVLGPKQGEFLGGLLILLGQPWNRHFAGGPIVIPDDGPLPRVTLAGGAVLTLVSPTHERLIELRDKWEDVIKAVDLSPGLGVRSLVEFGRMLTADSIASGRLLGDETRRSTLDSSEANGASIAFILEFEGTRMLFTGDGFADVIRPSLSRWLEEASDGDRVELDAFKLSHHGSKRNLTPQLMGVISCRNYLVSTSGAGNARHPDVEAIVMIRDEHHAVPADELPVVRFNYSSDQTNVYADLDWLTALYDEDSIVEL